MSNVIMIIVAFAYGGSAVGGAATHLMQVQFSNMKACESAAAKINPNGKQRNSDSKVEAICVSSS